MQVRVEVSQTFSGARQSLLERQPFNGGRQLPLLQS
jgi:hypothetical protein